MMGKVSINDFASVLNERKGLSKKKASAFLTEMFNVAQQGLNEDRLVKIKGFGTFKIIDVDDRESVNVNTGERVLIEGHGKITFTPDALMKELVNKPFSQFETVVLNDGVEFDDLSREVGKVEAPDSIQEPIEEKAPLVDFVENDTSDNNESDVEVAKVDESETVEPAAVEEPAVEEEPVVEEEPAVEEPQESVAVEETAPEDNSEDEVPEDSVDEAATSDYRKWVLLALFGCLLFGSGYLLGRYSQPSEPQKVEEISKSVKKPAPAKKAEPVKKSEPAPAPSKSESAPAPSKSEPIQVPSKPETPPTAVPESGISDKYAQMDARVRTGAYLIVGTDYVEKARTNDNVQRISKRTLGPGMECYIEVYNGIKANTELKPGQEIKIPKLQPKKKKSKKEN